MANRQQSDFEKSIERMCIGGRNQFADCFENFLDLALSYFCNNMDARQMHLRHVMKNDEDFMHAYVDALKAYGDLAEDYHDPLGDIFMNRISHGWNGQFFTPESISLLMTEIIGIGDGQSVNDPTCGSGRMLLMALKKAREEGKEPLLYANDISMTCAKMTLLNFCVNSVDGEVSCGNALTLDYENFTFFKLDKIRNIVNGAIFTTYWQYTLANVRDVEKKRKKWWEWVAENGWVEYHHVAVAENTEERQNFLPTEIRTASNGQLELF